MTRDEAAAERAARARLRDRRRELRARIAELREGRRAAVAQLKRTAKAGIVRARASMKLLRQSLRAAQKAETRVRPFLRAGARTLAARTVKAGKRALRDEAAKLRAELAAARSGTAKQAAERARAYELRSEREDFILADVPAELHPVYHRVKSHLGAKYRKNERQSAAEGFMHWTHDHAGDVVRILDEATEREHARAIWELTQLGRAAKSRAPRALAAAHGVPF